MFFVAELTNFGSSRRTPFNQTFLFLLALMAPSLQKASWRRIDTVPSDDDVRVGGVSSGAGIQPFVVGAREG